MVLTFTVVVMMTFALVMALWSLCSSWLANLSKSLLDRRNIRFIGIIGYCNCLSLQIEYKIFDTILELLVKRNVLQDLVAAILTM